MRWEGNRQSDNVIDLRDKVAGAGGATLGIGGTVVVLMLACCCGLCGGDPEVFLKQLDQEGGGEQPASQRQPKNKRQTKATPPVEDAPAGEDRMKAFVSTVLADTEDVWNDCGTCPIKYPFSFKTRSKAALINKIAIFLWSHAVVVADLDA